MRPPSVWQTPRLGWGGRGCVTGGRGDGTQECSTKPVLTAHTFVRGRHGRVHHGEHGELGLVDVLL